MANEYKPEWAKRIEDWGKEVEEKFSHHHCSQEETTKNEEGQPEALHSNHNDHVHQKDTRPRWQRQNSPIGDIFSNILSYFIVTYAPFWFPGFFLEGYSAVRIVIVLSIAVQIIASVLMLVMPLRPIYYLGKTIMNLASLVSMVVMVTIFPFNIPYGLGNIAQLGLWVAIAIVALVTFSNLLNIFGRDCQ